MDNILLDKKGYVFNVGKINGRFGNILICLENLLLLSKNTESIFKIKKIKNTYDTFTVPKLTYDFRSDNNDNCGEVIEHEKLFLTRDLFDKSLFFDKNNECLKYIHDLIKKQKPYTDIYDDTLVLNIRGGSDIFRKKRVNSKYIQPPLSFYKSIIKNYDGKDVLIVTDSIRFNPVIRKLIRWNPKIRVCDGNTTSQVNVILNVKHLVTARSTFSLILSRLSKNLKTIYIWWEDSKLWNDFEPSNDNCLSEDVEIIKYYSNDYIKSGEWLASKSQLKEMVNHPEEKLKYEVI